MTLFTVTAQNDLSILPWLFVIAVGLSGLAMIVFWLNGKNGMLGKNTAPMLPLIKWPLLFASAGFNVFFTYYVFMSAGQGVAFLMAFVMGGVNLAEAYLVRLTIATWRHSMKMIFALALAITIPVFGYSLMSASSTFSTMMGKNADVIEASNLRIQGARSLIEAANAEVDKAYAGESRQALIQALYSREVTNARGVPVRFEKVAHSCDRDGFYKANYSTLCNQYQMLNSDAALQTDVAQARQQAANVKANQQIAMAQIMESRPPEIIPTLLGMSLIIATVGLIISIALEAAIVGTAIFEELFVKPTALPAIVRFIDKRLDWDASTIKQNGLSVEVSPSAGTIGFNGEKTERPFQPVHGRNQRLKPPSNQPQLAPKKHPEKPHESVRSFEANAPVQTEHKAVNAPNAPVRERTEHTPRTHPTNAPNAPVKPTAKLMHSKVEKPVIDKTELTAILGRIKAAQQVKIGESMMCVICGSETNKTTDTKKVCSSKCRGKLNRLTKQGAFKVQDNNQAEKGATTETKQANAVGKGSQDENWTHFQFSNDGSLIASNTTHQRTYKASDLSELQRKAYKQLHEKTQGQRIEAVKANAMLREVSA